MGAVAPNHLRVLVLEIVGDGLVTVQQVSEVPAWSPPEEAPSLSRSASLSAMSRAEIERHLRNALLDEASRLYLEGALAQLRTSVADALIVKARSQTLITALRREGLYLVQTWTPQT